MKVGDSVRYSLDHWDRQEWEPAMLHACNAVDGTGKKRYPKKGVGDRFKSAIRDSMEVMAILGIPGIDLDKTRFPLRVRSDLPDKRPDVADVIYGIHRCSHGHGDELPDGFELTPYKNRSGVHEYSFENETARFPASVVLGLLAIAVFAPENVGQVVPTGYQLSWRDWVYPIGEWWGREQDFLDQMSGMEWIRVEMNWTDWWDDWEPIGGKR
ncbi:hypothetical protein [Gordonia humi]|uniref:Uncharacterized protein n=1 Tax=Gordonia humi TaxID=686429 RepID=A0A840F4L3_9ACTN|nr:hypothetical protein [Gordonia humi]MBB4137584.1 hypothetical protein [Gordonia humi]